MSRARGRLAYIYMMIDLLLFLNSIAKLRFLLASTRMFLSYNFFKPSRSLSWATPRKYPSIGTSFIFVSMRALSYSLPIG